MGYPPAQQRAYMARRHADRRARIVAIKLALACVDCGWKPADAEEAKRLDFDHIDPTTKGAPGAGAFRYSWSWPRIVAELALCAPRCKSCHNRRTYREGHHLKSSRATA